MLECLGVDMGQPFYMNDIPGDKENFYEPRDLSDKLRDWWNEPRMEATILRRIMISELKDWVQYRENLTERRGVRDVGAKHPILSMCGPELVQAWGADTKFIWSWRDFDESVASIRSRVAKGGFGNLKGHEESAQRKLWNAITEFSKTTPQLITIKWDDVKSNPERFARQLASLCSEVPSQDKILAAKNCIDDNHQS